MSYIQGLLLSLTFKIPINFFNYFPDLFTPIPVAVMFSIFYFLLYPALLNIHTVLSKKSEERSQDFVDSEMKNYILNVWNLKPEQIEIILYDDGDHPNVQREISNGNLIIHVGKNFLKLVNKSELLFTLSHEVAHYQGRDYRILFIVISMGYIVLMCIVGQLFSGIFATNVVFFIIARLFSIF